MHMVKRKLSRWLWLGLALNISIMVWRFWSIILIARLPYRSVTDWFSDPDSWMYLIFYGLGFVGIQMAVTGDRRPLLFWDVVYLLALVPLPLVRPVWFFGAVIATSATYIGHRRMRRELRTCEASLSK
jgi:hypothetical protein